MRSHCSAMRQADGGDEPRAGTTRAMWDAQHALTARHSLLLYDHRGLGASPAPRGPYTIEDLGGDVIAMLDKVGAGSVSFCGVALGGMVGLWIAANHPKRIRRLVVMATLSRLQPAAGFTERAASVRADGIGPIASSVVARWFTERFARDHPETVRRYVETLSAMDAEGYAGCCEAIATGDLRTAIHRVDAPTLIIAGAEDPIVPASSAVMFGASSRRCDRGRGSGCGAPDERRATGHRQPTRARASERT